MSTDYRAIIAIGKTFDGKYEVIDFLETNNILDDKEREEIDEHGLSEWLDSNDKGVYGECLDYYTGDYYYVGYSLSTCDPESFRKDFEEATSNWDEKFPNVEADVIRTVQVS